MKTPSAREDVRVVVAVVGAGVDAVRVAIDQLRDLLIVERGERPLLRLHSGGAELDSSSHERHSTHAATIAADSFRFDMTSP